MYHTIYTAKEIINKVNDSTVKEPVLSADHSSTSLYAERSGAPVGKLPADVGGIFSRSNKRGCLAGHVLGPTTQWQANVTAW